MKTKLKVHKLRNEGLTIPEICRVLNIKKGTVGYHLKSHNGPKRSKFPYKKQHLKTIKKTYNIEQILKDYKNIPINKILQKHSITTFKFYSLLKSEGIKLKKNRKSEFFPKVLEGIETPNNSYYSSITGSLKRAILKYNLLLYKCSSCSINRWQGSNITLDLDHIDGNRQNNVITNLRFLCPNCHSQTPTYKGRNKK